MADSKISALSNAVPVDADLTYLSQTAGGPTDKSLLMSALKTYVLTGTAAKASILATARAINGVNFDGSAPITVTAAAATLSGSTLPALDGGALTNLTAGNITGVVPPANLGTGSSITTKFLRGDGTWQTISGGGDALTSNPLSQFASTTSAQLAGVISDETGTGALVFAGSPTLTGTVTADQILPNRIVSTVHAFGNSTGAKTFDCASYQAATLTLTGDVTLTFATPSSSGLSTLTVIEVGDGTHQITYAGLTVTFPAGTPPVLGNGVKRTVQIVTTDGSTGLGFYSGAGAITGSGTTKLARFSSATVIGDDTGVVNADIATGAAIAYSKLALTGAVLNADLAGSIAYSKLSLTGAILNADLAGSIADSKLSQITTASKVDAGAIITQLNTQNASYTLVLGDAGKIVELNNASGNNLTVPTNASVAFPVGTIITVAQYGAGATTIVAAGGVTIRCRQTLVLKGQYAACSLYQRAANEWVLSGDLT